MVFRSCPEYKTIWIIFCILKATNKFFCHLELLKYFKLHKNSFYPLLSYFMEISSNPLVVYSDQLAHLKAGWRIFCHFLQFSDMFSCFQTKNKEIGLKKQVFSIWEWSPKYWSTPKWWLTPRGCPILLFAVNFSPF